MGADADNDEPLRRAITGCGEAVRARRFGVIVEIAVARDRIE